ncbi:MAG: N-acylglucosamine 2-epimerase [Ignavibacteriae bacterium]|nr:MAG: N-acylglucosamine 2-epimerase [Ignavibacteriota bacterium]
MFEHEGMIGEFQNALVNGILKRWYPFVLDTEFGGYFTNISHDWTLLPEQEKMIVSQCRHIWTLSKASEFLQDESDFRSMAFYGFPFLKEKMWDHEFGGFYQIRSREGGWSEVEGWRDEKRTYGNVFAVYALAALYGLTRDKEVLALARKTFHWIEDHAFDPTYKGYFQFLTREARPFDDQSAYRSIASDNNERGYKDQNSSIHLMEAYTELYHVWNDPKLYTQLQSILELIRDTMVSREGSLRLFFHRDWSPVSFRNCPEEERESNYGLDHVSFGHNVETAFLMLEASYALGLENDQRTLTVAKKMLDHALLNGFDEERGGFYDGGYYFKGQKKCAIIKESKTWWSQAEGLNALILFAHLYPHEEKYAEYFRRQWAYVKEYVIDPEQGDWFEGGFDKEPHFRTGLKSHIWKCTYHTCRALMNCISLLREDSASPIVRMAGHWRSVENRQQNKKPAVHVPQL